MTTQQLHEFADTTTGRPLEAEHSIGVLFATDESDAATHAEDWIRRLGWARTPAVNVLTVVPRRDWASGFGLQTYRPAVRDAVQMARELELIDAQRVANAVGSRFQQAGMPVRVWGRSGDAADEIVRASRMDGVDLVVLGRSRRSRRALPWARDVSSHVARHSEAAVLVAQPPPQGDGPLPRSVAILDVGESASAGAMRWLGDAGWISNAHRTTLSPGTSEGPGGQPSVEAFEPLLRQSGADLAVAPGTLDRREAETLLRVADLCRVSVLLLPEQGRHRPGSAT